MSETGSKNLAKGIAAATAPVAEDKKKDNSLGPTAVAYVTFIDQAFWTHGGVPTPEKIKAELGISKNKQNILRQDDRIKGALMARGIDLDEQTSNGLLTPQQVVVANLLMNLHDKRSVREKLQVIGVSSQQYHAWLRQPAFADYLRKRAENLFSSSDHVAYTQLIKSVEGGSESAIKLFMEMRGIYNPKLEVNINIQSVVVRLVEIVAKHVKDPLVLEAIATEVERLDVGGNALEQGAA